MRSFVLFFTLATSFTLHASPDCADGSSFEVVRTDLERLHVISHPDRPLQIELRPVFRQGQEHMVHVTIVDTARNETLERYILPRVTMMEPDVLKFSPDGETIMVHPQSSSYPEDLAVFRRFGGWVMRPSRAHNDGQTRLAFSRDAYFMDADVIFASQGAGLNVPLRYTLARGLAEPLTTRPSVTRPSKPLLHRLARVFDRTPGVPALPAVTHPPHPTWMQRRYGFLVDPRRSVALASHVFGEGSSKSFKFTLWDLRADPATAEPIVMDVASRLRPQVYGEPHQILEAQRASLAEEPSATRIVSESETFKSYGPQVRLVRPGIFVVMVNVYGQVTWSAESKHHYEDTARGLAFKIDVDDPEPRLVWESSVAVGDRAHGVEMNVTDGRLKFNRGALDRGGELLYDVAVEDF